MEIPKPCNQKLAVSMHKIVFSDVVYYITHIFQTEKLYLLLDGN